MMLYTLDKHVTTELAAKELARCLSAMAGTAVAVERSSGGNRRPGIYLGTGDPPGMNATLPEVADAKWDDAWIIRSSGDRLFIVGVNPRSTLMACYEYLRRLGAEWLHPGTDGECLPHIEDIPLSGFDISGKAAHRHRGVCIEGAPAIEHVLDMVEWLPRVGMNAYFLQFQTSSYFWRQWYRHDLNPTWAERRDPSEAECADLDGRVIQAVKERDLLLHRVGHGWTAAALGLPTNGWDTHNDVIPERRHLIAEVKGRRDLWGDVPINTELCYSNDEARRLMVDAVIQYAAAHPEVDVLHFWLSDAANNHCGCEACARLDPSDWYAVLLNELSPRLKRTAPQMKLAFLAYLDTLWPPRQTELDLSQGNLVYMFAPISRCYGHNLRHPDCGTHGQLERPPLNATVIPEDNLDNEKLLQLWRSSRPADSFAYDYHFMTVWLQDRLSVDLADIIPKDIADYSSHDVSGIVNCCSQRAFYPNGWPFYVMARTLWGEEPNTDVRRRYFTLAYGANAAVVLEFLDGLRNLSGAPVHRSSWWETADDSSVREMLAFLAAQEIRLKPASESAETAAQQRAWELLLHYRQLLEFLWTALQNRLAGREDAARAELGRAEAFLRTTEKETAGALDTFLMLQYLSRLP
jgi:hypothetical protein